MKKFTRFAGISESGLSRLANVFKQAWDPSFSDDLPGSLPGDLPGFDEEAGEPTGELDIGFAEGEISKLLENLPEDERRALLEDLIGQLDEIKAQEPKNWDPSVLSSLRNRLASLLG